jgi:hypothetical protein
MRCVSAATALYHHLTLVPRKCWSAIGAELIVGRRHPG